MRIAVPAEARDEPRVAATPETVKKLVGLGGTVTVQAGAGLASGITDAAFEAAGATIALDVAAALDAADVVLKVRRPEAADLAHYRHGALVLAIMDPYGQDEALAALATAGVDAFAMELMPRITRAQVMDVLSSQANLAGYRAVIDAAEQYGRAFPDDDDGRRDRAGRQGFRDGRRSGGPPGHSDGAPPRCDRDRDRRAPGDEGTGRIARRQVRGGRERRVQAGRDRRRLRQADVGGLPAPAERTGGGPHRQAGHRHHDGADPRPAGADGW